MLKPNILPKIPFFPTQISHYDIVQQDNSIHHFACIIHVPSTKLQPQDSNNSTN